MKKGLLGIVLLFSIQSVIGQDQPAPMEQQKTRLQKITDFIVRNKACLSGTDCSPRFSLFLNYMLGTAYGLATGMGVIKASQVIGEKTGQGGAYTAAISGGIIMEIVENLGYSALIQKVSLEGINKIRCITVGDGCSLAQRRYLFFQAGSLGGVLGAVALSVLQGKFREREQFVLQ